MHEEKAIINMNNMTAAVLILHIRYIKLLLLISDHYMEKTAYKFIKYPK